MWIWCTLLVIWFDQSLRIFNTNAVKPQLKNCTIIMYFKNVEQYFPLELPIWCCSVVCIPQLSNYWSWPIQRVEDNKKDLSFFLHIGGRTQSFLNSTASIPSTMYGQSNLFRALVAVNYTSLFVFFCDNSNKCWFLEKNLST